MTIKILAGFNMDFDKLERAIPIKTNLQNAIVNCLSQEELADIWSSTLNESVIEKLILLARPYFKEEPTDKTLDVLALSIGTIIKEYEWGLYYLHKEGFQELKDRIRNGVDIIPRNQSICEELLNGNNHPKGEPIKFDSSDHIRYANGVDVSGHNYGCNRQIEIQKNIEGGEGYTVTIYNLDGVHPLWGNNIQMAPKQMRIIDAQPPIVGGTLGLVSLRGYGYDMMGSPYSDYAIDLIFNGKEIEKVILKMLDRNIELEYLK